MPQKRDVRKSADFRITEWAKLGPEHKKILRLNFEPSVPYEKVEAGGDHNAFCLLFKDGPIAFAVAKTGEGGVELLQTHVMNQLEVDNYRKAHRAGSRTRSGATDLLLHALEWARARGQTKIHDSFKPIKKGKLNEMLFGKYVQLITKTRGLKNLGIIDANYNINAKKLREELATLRRIKAGKQ